jgi:hypothetical protein
MLRVCWLSFATSSTISRGRSSPGDKHVGSTGPVANRLAHHQTLVGEVAAMFPADALRIQPVDDLLAYRQCLPIKVIRTQVFFSILRARCWRVEHHIQDIALLLTRNGVNVFNEHWHGDSK